MKTVDTDLVAKFIAQRMEMGESEWYIGPVACDMQEPGETSAVKNIVGQTELQNGKDLTITNEHPVSGIIPSEDGIDSAVISIRDELGELEKTVYGCMRCQLGETRNKFVFGDGNPHADVMFIGEAPGADEDKQGLPFVGRAGKLLTRMIESIKFHREDVYIGNILKCRPPGNRDPKPEEIELCEPILIRQIEIIKPKIICALGRIAGQTLLRTKSTLGALRGKIHDYHGVKLVVTYHPAALLRNPNWKRDAWDDLKFLRYEYDGMEL